MFLQDLKRGLTSISFWIGIVIFAGSISLVAIGADQQYTPLAAYHSSFLGQIAYMPSLLCVLPLGTTFYDEWNSLFYRYSISRVGWAKYIRNRIFSSAILGGLIVMVSSFTALLFCYTYFTVIPNDAAQDAFFPLMAQDPIMKLWLPGGIEQIIAFSPMDHVRLEALYGLSWMLNLFLFGACWSQLGLAVSAWADDWALILVFPFVFFILMEWASMQFGLPLLSTKGIVCQFGELIYYPYWILPMLSIVWGGLFIAFFILGMRRRRRDE